MDSFSNIPINRHLGFQLISQSSKSASISMEPRPEFLQEEGIIHGAIVTALADTAAVYIFHPGLSPDMTMSSIEFKLNFLSPALPDGGTITARSSLVRKGRKIGVCEVDVMQGIVTLQKDCLHTSFTKENLKERQICSNSLVLCL